MSPERTARRAPSSHDADATQRQRFGLILASGVGLIAAGLSYYGTRDAWVTADRSPDAEVVETSGVGAEPAWDIELPEVEQFVQAHGLDHVLVDSYNVADPSFYVPQGSLWDCQAATAADAGRWAFVSADMFADAANCTWMLATPHQALAGGSMYAFHLPGTILAAGSPGGPPLAANYRYIGGAPFDWRDVMYRSIRDPRQMQSVMDDMMKTFAEMQKNQKKK